MQPPYALTWDLDPFFPGGSGSPAFRQALAAIEAAIDRLEERLRDLPAPMTAVDHPRLAAVVDDLQDIQRELGEAGSFASCLEAQDVRDDEARLLHTRVKQLEARLDDIRIDFAEKLRAIPDADWQALLAQEPLCSLAFPLSEYRRMAADRLPPEQERLVNDLSVDGYHAWSQLYYTLVGRMTIPCCVDGRTVHLSVGQAANKLTSADRQLREGLFAAWEEAWAGQADLFAACLNHLGGYRLRLYRLRGWSSVLKEPLDLNRLAAATLHTMWEVVVDRREPLTRYLRRKAEILGVEGLEWHDCFAPLQPAERPLAFQEAAELIIESFNRFDPELAAFARHAFTHRWIEAEDRPHKRPGGFCTSFPKSRQSRIFMTFSGTLDNLLTLAHELGHAYHQKLVDPLPPLLQDYPMTLAETASTLAEAIVLDGLLRASSDPDWQRRLLEERLRRAVSFVMDIRARFLFETRFYEERKRGPLSVAQLNALMVDAQKEAFAGTLAVYHPHFWASKLHFYLTEVPFYNFPYTFGYLFSAGIYHRAREEGGAFARKYAKMMRDSGRMTVEQLAQQHLGVDLTKPSFWEETIDAVLGDVEAFLRSF